MVKYSLLRKSLRHSGRVQYPKSDLFHEDEVVWTSWRLCIRANALDDYFDYRQDTVPGFVSGSAEITQDVESL